MSLRARTEQALSTDGWPRRFAWALAPLLCLAMPGPGAILAFVWLVGLLVFGRQSFGLLGLSRPPSWIRLLAYSLLVAAVIHGVADYAIEPFARWVSDQPPDTSKFQGFLGDWRKLAFFLLLSWLVGAALEETVFRGFMIAYGATIFGARYQWPLAVFSSAVFGLSHLYQGTAGVVLTSIVGLMLAAAFIRSRKNLPLVMLAHGFVDTISMVQLFLGSANVP